VTYIERDNRKIMIALLGSQDRFGETKELIDWIFSNYSWQEVKYPG
jgi:D-alanyl-D-alanine carboxypeptidase